MFTRARDANENPLHSDSVCRDCSDSPIPACLPLRRNAPKISLLNKLNSLPLRHRKNCKYRIRKFSVITCSHGGCK